MKHSLKILVFAAMFLYGVTVWGQEREVLFQNINTALSQGDCDRAQRNYNVWKDFTNNTDSSIVRRIAECRIEKTRELQQQVTKSGTTVAPPVEIKIEPILEVSASDLFFGDMGDEEKSVNITSNAPWRFSQASDWIKVTLTQNRAALKVTCNPNISKIERNDSLIIQADDKKKIINIAQAAVADPLLTGKQMLDQDKIELAEQYFQLVAGGTNAEDWNKLAKIYVDKRGEENFAKAFDLLKKSAATNNRSGMCSLGYMYEKGLGTPKDDNSAVKYYTSSALLNFAPAQYNLGLMYEYGIGVKQDKKEAEKWYKKAANQGFVQAQRKLNQ